MTVVYSFKRQLQVLLGIDVEFEIVFGDDFKIVIINWERLNTLRQTEILSILQTTGIAIKFDREDTVIPTSQ